jgi:mono/diheme cytochrome c family protein
MSDLSAAAEALGIPEAIVMRSAAARAAETGMTVDEVLSTWAGGGAAPVSTAPTAEPAPPEAEPEPAVESPSVDEPARPPAAATETPTPTLPPVTAPSGPWKPPVLIGKPDNPVTVFVGAVGLFLAILLVGLVGPVLPAENPGARTSELPFTEAAQQGHDIYQSIGCAACHTQMVRPVIADVGLGAVTLNDSNQVLGTRRFGPDLADVGSRLSGSQIEATVTGFGGHPSESLTRDDLDDLVAYLLESKTSVEPRADPTSGESTEEETG